MSVAWNMLNASLAALVQATGHVALTNSGASGVAVTALALSALTCALTACVLATVWLGRIAAAEPLASRVAALRDRSRRTAFVPQRDPDAAGRPRPRAPSSGPAAA